MADRPSNKARLARKWIIAAVFAATLIWAFVASGPDFRFFGARTSFSPHGGMLAVRIDWDLTIWDIAEQEPVLSVPGVVWEWTFSHDESRLAVAAGKRIRIWQVTRGRQVQELSGHVELVERIAFTPDGRSIAVCYAHTTLRLWDVESGATVFSVDAHEEACRGPAISHDGALIATGGRDVERPGCEVRLWSTQDGTLRGAISVDDHEYVHSLRFHPDRRHLLVKFAKPKGTAIWDLTDLADIKPAASQIAAPAAVHGVFSPQWDRFATSTETGRYDHTLTLHRTADGSEVFTTPPLPGLGGRRFFLDGDRLLVASRYCDVLEFDLTSGKLVKQTHALRPVRWCWQWSAMLALFGALMQVWIVLWHRYDERAGARSVAGRPADAWLVPANAIILAGFAAALHWDQAAFYHEHPSGSTEFLLRLMVLQIVSGIVMLVCGLVARAWAAITLSLVAGIVGFGAVVVHWHIAVAQA